MHLFFFFLNFGLTGPFRPIQADTADTGRYGRYGPSRPDFGRDGADFGRDGADFGRVGADFSRVGADFSRVGPIRELPRGVRFSPKDKEVIELYLKKKITRNDEESMKHGCVSGLGYGCGCGCGTRQFLKKVDAGAAGLGD